MRSLILIPFVFLSGEVFSQFRGNNLMELQAGNVPGDNPADLITHYNRLNLLYTYKNIRGSLRYEHFLHPEQNKDYHRLSQFNLNYRNKGLELKVGHFNETLGNGILLRSYEIPGSVFEDQAYRVKQGFYRDLKGIAASYDHRFFKIKIVRARSLLNLFPPTFDEKERRPDLSEALQIESRVLKQNIGIMLMRNHNTGRREDFSSVFLKGLIKNFSYNFEFARQLDDPAFFKLEDASSWGFYGSLNYSFSSTGISLEYKDYHNIFIGSGISDPPTLIREQSYRVLNRSTHVPELTDESGWQFEAYQSFSNGNMLTLNYAWTKNQLFRDFVFQEYFLEYEMRFRNYDVLRLFIDYSKDPLRLEDHRYSGGFLVESYFGSSLGASFQFEYQYFERELLEKQTVNNLVFFSSLYSPSAWSIGINVEASSDPIQTALLPEGSESNYRFWPGLTGSYHINDDNKITFFAGKRRGGPACTSGICYEVLDFEGLEVRLTTKF